MGGDVHAFVGNDRLLPKRGRKKGRGEVVKGALAGRTFPEKVWGRGDREMGGGRMSVWVRISMHPLDKGRARAPKGHSLRPHATIPRPRPHPSRVANTRSQKRKTAASPRTFLHQSTGVDYFPAVSPAPRHRLILRARAPTTLPHKIGRGIPAHLFAPEHRSAVGLRHPRIAFCSPRAAVPQSPR
jgi:hypothetical protein